jgi:hypothetical protein
MDTRNSETYINLTWNRVFSELTEEERLYGYFQQDSANEHTAGNSMAAISDVFGDTVISEGVWSVSSPDITPYDFYFRGNLKDKLY